MSLWFWIAFLRMSDVACPLMYVLKICVSPLRCLLKSFVYSLIGFFGFLLLSGKNSLIILLINTSSDTWFADSLSHSVGCCSHSSCLFHLLC
jgi:hypothetical protein